MIANFEDLGKVYGKKVFARPKNAIFILLKSLETEASFIVSNTHLLGNWQLDYVKMAQGLYLLEKACDFADHSTQLLNKDKDYVWPQIFCGDFNSSGSESTTQILYYDTNNIEENPSKLSTWTIPAETKEKYRKEYRHIHTKMFLPRRDHFLKKLGLLKSAYENYNKNVEAQNKEEFITKSYPAYTNYTDEYKSVLDHIWYNAEKITCNAILEIPGEEHVATETALPNSVYPSDHLKIQAKLTIH